MPRLGSCAGEATTPRRMCAARGVGPNGGFGEFNRWPQRCASEVAGDGAQRFSPANPQQNLLALADRQTPWPWLPAQWLGTSMPALAHHEADHWRRAANLLGYVDQAPALRSQPERQLLLLRAQVTMSP